ncbi:MAG TPA: hypothetical protein VNZ44_10590, partial [Pyrinomonadaceae bacterium]|nr:hypothetical protein [Pyrinomonadaceae bacterium]
MREESGAAENVTAKPGTPGVPPPEKEFSYSCQIDILRPRLGEKDLKKVNGRVALSAKLREAARRKTPPSRYSRLRNQLSEPCKRLLSDEQNKKLLPTLLAELNLQLANGGMRALLENILPVLPRPERELLAQAGLGDNDSFASYLRFCSIFAREIESLEGRLKQG